MLKLLLILVMLVVMMFRQVLTLAVSHAEKLLLSFARSAPKLSASWLIGFLVAIASALAICLWAGSSSVSLTIVSAFALIGIVAITANIRLEVLGMGHTSRLSSLSTQLRYMQSGVAYAKQLA